MALENGDTERRDEYIWKFDIPFDFIRSEMSGKQYVIVATTGKDFSLA